MSKLIPFIWILLRLFLGGMMIYGGIEKFSKPIPSPLEVLEKAEKFKDPAQTNTLQKVLYINGAKQTGYFWQVLGVTEILFGLLVVLQGTAFVGAIFLLPISLHIFLFHLFLEPDEVYELVLTSLLLITNIALVLKEKNNWKHLLWLKPL